MKYMRKTGGYTWAECKTNNATAKELNTNSVFGQNAGLQNKMDTTRTKNASWQITEDNKTTYQKAVETREDHWRDFWLCETGMS